MGKRIDILNAFYNVLPSIVGDNYVALKSQKNGASGVLDIVEDTAVHFKIGNELSSDESEQSIYFLSAPIEVSAYKRFVEPVDPMLSEIAKETVKSDMIEQLRVAFGSCPMPALLCSAGVRSLNYIQELEPEDVGGDTVAVKLEFEINWRDRRK
jgi:hypothetical protein